MKAIVTEVTLRYNEADYTPSTRLEEYASDCAAALKAMCLHPEDFYSFRVGNGYTTFRNRLDKVD